MSGAYILAVIAMYIAIPGMVLFVLATLVAHFWLKTVTAKKRLMTGMWLTYGLLVAVYVTKIAFTIYRQQN